MDRSGSFVLGAVAALISVVLSAPLTAAAGDDLVLAQATPEPLPTPTPDPCSAPTPAPSPSPSLPSPDPSPSTTPIPCPTPTEEPPEDTLGPRPYGLSGLKDMFGRRCNRKANDSRTWFPHAWGRGEHGYVYYHRKLLGKVWGDVQQPLLEMRKKHAFDYGIWGYACRIKTGGTSWSVHSWGAAIDTNTLRNPFGQTFWVGKGAKGKRFGRTIPNAYMNEDFYWGLNFNDPMHFQYVSGY